MPRFTLRRLGNQPLPANVKSLSPGLRWSPGTPLGRKPWQARERIWPSWDPGCTCWRGGTQTLWWTVFLGTTLAPWGGASLTGPNTARNCKVNQRKGSCRRWLPSRSMLVRSHLQGHLRQRRKSDPTLPSRKTRKWNWKGLLRHRDNVDVENQWLKSRHWIFLKTVQFSLVRVIFFSLYLPCSSSFPHPT